MDSSQGQTESTIATDSLNLKTLEVNFKNEYGIGTMRGIRSKIMEDFEMRSAPACDSQKTGITVKKNEILFVYKYFNEERCWAAEYNHQWGFIKDDIVFPVFEDNNEKQASKYDEPPQLKTQIKPVYPAEAKKKGITGKVYVKVYIDDKGVAQDAIILRGIDELNQAAIDAVKNAKYKPAKYEGKEVGVWVNLSILFN
jgi:TonB family protein